MKSANSRCLSFARSASVVVNSKRGSIRKASAYYYEARSSSHSRKRLQFKIRERVSLILYSPYGCFSSASASGKSVQMCKSKIAILSAICQRYRLQMASFRRQHCLGLHASEDWGLKWQDQVTNRASPCR